MAALPIAVQIGMDAVLQVRRSIALLKALRLEAGKDAEQVATINAMIAEVLRHIRAIGAPTPALQTHVRGLATILKEEIVRIKALPKVQRGTVPKNALPGGLAPLQDRLVQWRAGDVHNTNLTDEIDNVLRATPDDFIQHIAQVNAAVNRNHGEFQYQLNTARVERLLAIMGEVLGVCAVYGTQLDPMSPDRTQSDMHRQSFEIRAVTSPLEEQFQQVEEAAQGLNNLAINSNIAAAVAGGADPQAYDEFPALPLSQR